MPSAKDRLKLAVEALFSSSPSELSRFVYLYVLVTASFILASVLATVAHQAGEQALGTLRSAPLFPSGFGSAHHLLFELPRYALLQ